LATRFTGARSYFVTESSVDRLLEVHHLIAGRAFIVRLASTKALSSGAST
jgi:hypothetical protein